MFEAKRKNCQNVNSYDEKIQPLFDIVPVVKHAA